MSDNHFELHHTAPDVDNSHPIEVAVTGEVDAANAAAFTQAIHALPGSRPLIVNLSSAFYFDSAGFAALDRLLAGKEVVLVVEPSSTLFAATALVCMPTHPSCSAARQSLLHR